MFPLARFIRRSVLNIVGYEKKTPQWINAKAFIALRGSITDSIAYCAAKFNP
jgi:hypothetical protein